MFGIRITQYIEYKNIENLQDQACEIQQERV